MAAPAPRPKLTAQQQAAIETREVSVALSAGAGCGKTFVLVERYFAQLEEAIQSAAPDEALSRIVAITFTERAAREMRDRIRARCRQRLQEATSADDSQRWLGVLRALDAARVSTIHAFCAGLLRSNAVEAALDPVFSVLDETETTTFLALEIEEGLRRSLAAHDEVAIDLAAALGIEGLRDRLQELLWRRAAIRFDEWRDVDPDTLVARWREFEERELRPLRMREIVDSPHMQAVLRIARMGPARHPVMQERLRVLAEVIPKLDEGDLPELLRQIHENARVQGGGAAKLWADSTLYAEFRDAAGVLRGAVEALEKLLAGATDDTDPRRAAQLGLALLQLVEPIAAAYENRKRELAALDFDDLLVRTRDLLRRRRDEDHPALADTLDLLLVDEFQDTDRIQVEIVRLLAGDVGAGKLFVVGDVKQSIYRFRAAEPQVFRELRQEIAPAGRLPLTLNFRSQPAILHFVNALFCDDMEVEYEPLLPCRKQVTEVPAVEFLWAVRPEIDSAQANGGAETDDDADSPRAAGGQNDKESLGARREREADWIARRLRQMLDEGSRVVTNHEAGGNGARPLQMGDIAILFRALSDVQLYEEALQRYEIDYYVVGGKAYYAQQEVFDLVNLLRAISNPADEVALAGVLRSPMFALTDETLFWLCASGGGGLAASLAGALETGKWPAELASVERLRAEHAARTIKELRQLKDSLPIAGLVNEALARTGYDAVLLAEYLGERKLANLYKLIEQARATDAAHLFSLADFITQLTEMVARQPDEPLAATQRESADVVRLMTIHQAKGLEFPMVIVPDLERSDDPPRDRAAFHETLGPLVRPPDDDNSGLGMRLYRASEEAEDRAERIRLLYVATTRAADYLLLSAGVTNVDPARGAWRQLLAGRFDLASGRLLADLPDGYEVPEIRVTTTEPTVQEARGGSHRRPDLARIVNSVREKAAGPLAPLPEFARPVAESSRRGQMLSFSQITGALEPAELSEAHDALTSTMSAEGTADAVSEPDLEAVREPADAARLGTLVHDVLARIDFRQPGDIGALVERVATGRLDVSPRDVERARSLVQSFLQTGRAAKLAAATEGHAELEFVMGWPPEKSDFEGPCLRGFIDRVYRDASGDWHIVDYKSNAVSGDDMATVAKTFELQLALYALVVEKLLGSRPATLILHFLHSGQEHVVDWNDERRRHAIAALDKAIAAVAGRSTSEVVPKPHSASTPQRSLFR